MKGSSNQEQITNTYPLDKNKIDNFYDSLRGNCPDFSDPECGTKTHPLQEKYVKQIALVNDEWIDS